MSLLRQISFGLRKLLRRERAQQEIAEELRHFYAEAETELRQNGLSADEARRMAVLHAGSAVAARDQAYAYGWESGVQNAWADLRYAARQLRRYPTATVTVLLTLAIGLGVNTAIFSVVEAVLLAPLPYTHAERLVALQTHFDEGNRSILRVTGPDVSDVRREARSFAAVSLSGGGNLAVQIGDRAAYTTVTLADENFARVFSLQPVAGRLFRDGEAKHAALVGERFAKLNFGSVSAAIGKTLRVDGEPAAITGVLPAAFDYPSKTQVWLAAPLAPVSTERTAFNYKAVALLNDGVGLPTADAELNTISGRLSSLYPVANAGKQLRLLPLQRALTDDTRPTLLILWAAAGFVLLLVCVNVMQLQLVRSIDRQRELAIRRALGCSRWRVVQPVFLESLLLALAGVAGGVVLSVPTLRLLLALAPAELPRAAEIGLHTPVLVCALTLGVLTAVISAAAPALRATAVDPADALKVDTSRGSTSRGVGHLREGLVMAEVAVTFVLAVGAGLLLRTLLTLQARDMGYQTRQLLIVDADAPAASEAEALRAVARFGQIFESLSQLPGVVQVAGVMGLPTGTYGSNGYYETRGGVAESTDHKPSANFTVNSPQYFRTLGIPMLHGRDFSEADTHESGMVAIISSALARQSFGTADPLGHQIRCGLDSDKWMTIVGVVGDVRQDSPAEKPGPTLYMPMTQHPFYANQINIVLRTAMPPLSLRDAVDRRIAAVNPLIARRYTTIDALLDNALAAERFRTALLAIMTGLGVLLAMLGVYGTVAYLTVQRRFDFGVRMAFGAKRRIIFGTVLRRTVRMAALGIGAGVAGSFALTRFVTSFLVGVSPMDPLSLAGVGSLLLFAAVAAGVPPAWHATRVSPAASLRAE